MNYEPSSSASSDVQVIILQRGKVVNNPALARKIKQNAFKALKCEKSKRKARLNKRKVKHKCLSDAKVRKSKMNSTKNGRVCKKKSSHSVTDLNKKNKSKASSKGDKFNKSGNSVKLQQINKNKRGLCHSEVAEVPSISKALKLTIPSTSKFLDNDKHTSEQNIWSLQEDSEKITEKPLTEKTDENKFQVNKFTSNRKEDVLPDEIKEEFNNSFGDAEAKFLSSGELHSCKESETDISDNVGPHDVSIMENSEMYSLLLIELITDEFKKQEELAKENLRIGKKFEYLLSDNDCETLQKFFEISNSARKLFVRMLNRKKSWHRVNTINYQEISHNLEKEFTELCSKNYMDLNIEEEDVKTQLQLLSKPEVLNICKKFKVSLKTISSGKKDDCINAIIKEFEQQKSVLEILQSKNPQSRKNHLLKDVKETLGMCVKLNKKTLETFYKVLLLNSFAYYTEDEEQRFNKVLLIYLLVKKNIMKFPNYKVCPTTVFEFRADFEEYKEALQLYNNCEIAMRKKDFNGFKSICVEAKQKFEQILADNEYKNRLLNMKSFLLKYTAGTVYARLLTNYCTKFLRKINKEDVIVIVKLLLGQDLFLKKKKGDWYEILSKTLESQKENEAAAEVLVEALKDPLITEVQRATIQLRAQSMLKRRIKDIQLQDTLKHLCILPLLEPNEIEITGLTLEGNQSGQKSVYIQQSQNEVVLTSVEDRAIFYYKEEYTKGYHSEGLILQTLYFLVFFDIIYGVSPEGVFQSPYQDTPLDFYCSCFYNNRKEEIELLLKDMCEWDDKKIEDKIRFAYNTHNRLICLIKWDTEFTLDDLCEVAKCISVPKLIPIFRKFIKNFREVRAGFPDLTLWNPETKKCIFVEVKSPSDKLSPAQRVWLTFLRNIGLNCEVCHVKNVSSKSCRQILRANRI